MPSIITTDFRITNALGFIENIVDEDINFYTLIGRPQPWVPTEYGATTPNEIEPPAPIDNSSQYFSYWADALAARRITASDVISMARRFVWVSGTVYTPYSHDMDLGSTFYVMNSEFNVYKCIDNNYGAPASVEPLGSSYETFTTLDGYKWKYMYTISQADALKYLTADYMPIRENNDVRISAIDGTLERIEVVDGGYGYTVAPIVTITGNGTGATATATIDSNGKVNKIIVTDIGSGYRYAQVNIEPPASGGLVARAKPIIAPKGGHGYDIITELNGYYVGISNQFDYDTISFPKANDYRRICMIRNPLLTPMKSDGTYNSAGDVDTVASGPTYRLTKRLMIEHISGQDIILTDDTIEGVSSGARGIFVGYQQLSSSTPVTYLVDYVQQAEINTSEFMKNENLEAVHSGGVWKIKEVYPAELIAETGRIIFVEQRRPIMRAPDQTENIIIICEF